MTDTAAQPLTALDDRELVRMMRDQSSSTFQVLFARHARPIHIYIRRRLVDDNDIDDVFQEVFTRAWSKLDARRMTTDSALPWLILTARNLVSNANAKASRRTTSSVDGAELVSADNALGSVIDSEVTDALSHAMAKLSDLDRKIIESCMLDRRLYKEVARDTGNSIGVIRNRLSRVRRFLRGELSELRGGGS